MIDSRALRSSRALARCWSAGLLALACGGTPEVPRCDSNEAITLHVHPAVHLNPDRAGLPRSVVVRVYQLDDARAFASSPFERVWAGGADGLPKPEQVIALPGRNQVQSLRRDPNARYLAVAANFREREGGSDGRALLRLPPPQTICGEALMDSADPIELTLADYDVHLR
ncbi:MAG TPA: type VI secretion system lipoprotein TssJ [Polyangiaceae bacterium]|nr:type VI secretion system lipoprotein TssJ [Polyangiaceae bacterium]